MSISKHSLVAGLISLSLAAPVAADHWMATADPQVVQALNELVWVYGSYCQQGQPQACQAAQAVQQQGGMMLNAGYDCQVKGDPNACQFYQQAYGMLAATHGQVQQAMMMGQMQQPAPSPGVTPLGATHADRMNAIQQWGQDRTQWSQQRSLQMDAQHQRFMETLRN